MMVNEVPHTERRFWARLALSMLVVAVPLAWGLVMLDVPRLAVVVASVVAAVALLAIWDGTRWLPQGLIPWARPTALQDEPTGLYNPKGWCALLSAEDDRCDRYSLTAAVVAVKVRRATGRPGAQPDEVTMRAGAAIRRLSRTHDVVAYLATDTFAVLAINSSADECDAVISRVRGGLSVEGLRADFAVADREGCGGLTAATAAALRQLGSDWEVLTPR